jgi:hypothetical protein
MPKRTNIKKIVIIGLVLCVGGLAASASVACSASVETAIVVNRLKGHLTFEGEARPGMSVELRRVTKRGKEVITTVR